MMQRSARSPHIVAGIDGSPASLRALRWAWSQAELTGAALSVVIAWHQPSLSAGSAGAGVEIPLTDWAEAAGSQLEDAIRDTLGEDGFRSVTRLVSRGHSTGVLMQAARNADLLVVGTHGNGTFLGALSGSVSLHLAHHAPCPLTIIPSPRETQTLSGLVRKIVVAVDGSPSSLHTLRWASHQGKATDAWLEAVKVCAQSTQPADSGAISPERRGNADLELHHAIVDALGYQAARNVTETVLEGHAVPTLTAAATDADMLVVGAGGHGTLAGLLFGSVSTQLWNHPPCPLTIIPLPDARHPTTRRLSWHHRRREQGWALISRDDTLGADDSR
jgi:nucleotide-binding universal stress UspA family protein